MVPKLSNYNHYNTIYWSLNNFYISLSILITSDWNLMILVPFDSPLWDDSNGTKIVKFWPLDREISATRKFVAQLYTLYIDPSCKSVLWISHDPVIRIWQFWYHSKHLIKTKWTALKLLNSQLFLSKYLSLHT